MALMEWAAPLATFLTVCVAVWGIYMLATAEQVAVQQRLGKYGSAQAAARPARTSALLKDRSFSDIGVLDRALRGRGYAERVALDLARAAVPLRVGEYLLIRWIIACALFLFTVLLQGPWLLGLLLAVVGFYLPRFYVARRERGRIRRIEDQLVDALTMMANSLKSGSSFLQAMDLVSRELPPPISQEFAQMVAEVGVGASLEQALRDLSQRVRSYDVYLIITAMTIQRSVGGNLAEVLEKIAHTIRERQRLLRQVVVETAEERFSAYILMILPSLMVVLLSIVNRQYIETLWIDNVGRLLLVGAILMQICGFFIMRRVAEIRV